MTAVHFSMSYFRNLCAHPQNISVYENLMSNGQCLSHFHIAYHVNLRMVFNIREHPYTERVEILYSIQILRQPQISRKHICDFIFLGTFNNHSVWFHVSAVFSLCHTRGFNGIRKQVSDLRLPQWCIFGDFSHCIRLSDSERSRVAMILTAAVAPLSSTLPQVFAYRSPFQERRFCPWLGSGNIAEMLNLVACYDTSSSDITCHRRCERKNVFVLKTLATSVPRKRHNICCGLSLHVRLGLGRGGCECGLQCDSRLSLTANLSSLNCPRTIKLYLIYG
jgi:hypothetical protein